MLQFSPHLEILPPPQRALWNELSDLSREFVLYGGTALALHLAHRTSVDFDLFGSRELDVSQIERGVSFLLRLLPEDMKLRLAAAAREVDLDHLPGIEKFSRQINRDSGYQL